MKRCVLCGQIKPVSEFNRKRASNDGRQDVCRGCNRQVSRDYYARNREKHLHAVQLRKQRARRVTAERLFEYLSAHPCVDCGESDVRLLEFDHLRDKAANIARLVGDAAAWDRILAEIAKCDVVCCNCHRRRTAERALHLRLRLLWERGSSRHTPRQARLWVGDV